MWADFYQRRLEQKVSPRLIRGSVNKPLIVFILSISLASAGFLTAYFWWMSQLGPVSPNSDSQVEFIVPLSQSAADTVSNLYRNRLIKSPLVAKFYLKFTGLDQKIRPGSYNLSPGFNLPTLINSLISGPNDIWVTFPEGWRREQIGLRLKNTLPMFPLADFLEQTATLEGRLFPDTYLIPPSADVFQIIAILEANFFKKTQVYPDQTYPIPFGRELPSLSGSQTLILSSLVEREARLDADRPTIAGILLKRYLSGWPLQVDATVQYAQDTDNFKIYSQSERISNFKFWEPIFDTKYPSPYNTYLAPGLPPAPIANPGLAAITSVLHPQYSDYWYYLTGTDGVTRYAATIDEHQTNIDKYLKP